MEFAGTDEADHSRPIVVTNVVEVGFDHAAEGRVAVREVCGGIQVAQYEELLFRLGLYGGQFTPENIFRPLFVNF